MRLIHWSLPLILRLALGHLFNAIVAALPLHFGAVLCSIWRFSRYGTQSESFNAL
ncbi:MAG: hypothetical protein ACRD7E_29810 [Bryobacteraceae bacterium]